jgi:hypothetical protein
LRVAADFGEAHEDEAEDGRGVFPGFEAGVGAKLVSGNLGAFSGAALGGMSLNTLQVFSGIFEGDTAK